MNKVTLMFLIDLYTRCTLLKLTYLKLPIAVSIHQRVKKFGMRGNYRIGKTFSQKGLELLVP